jgi:peptidoglycan hydrolase-like protein with peptidoglycan-binding domain
VKLPASTVYTPTGAAGFQRIKRWQEPGDANLNIEPGDIVYFDFPGDGVDRISHVGIVVRDNGDGTCVTVEGNTAGVVGDQRNGGMVLKKTRAYKKNKYGIQVSVVGFGKPRFPGPEKAATPKPEKPVDTFAYPKDPIQPGEVADYVKVIQSALEVKVDGIYGPITKKAVIAWQKANPKFGDADGVVGPKTFAALKRKSKV